MDSEADCFTFTAGVKAVLLRPCSRNRHLRFLAVRSNCVYKTATALNLLLGDTGCSTISDAFPLTWPEGREPRDQQTRAIDARDLSGIAQEIRDGWIMAFPNPTESMITISVSADKLTNSTVEVRVTDFLGRTVYSGNMQQAGDRYESSFNMGNLRRGLYYIHVEDGTVSYRKTVKKE